MLEKHSLAVFLFAEALHKIWNLSSIDLETIQNMAEFGIDGTESMTHKERLHIAQIVQTLVDKYNKGEDSW